MKSFTLLLGWLVAALSVLAPVAQAQTCAAPTGISVSSPTATTVVVSFAPVASAIRYVVRYNWLGDSTAAGVVRRTTPSSPVTLTGLRPASTYAVAVGSICGVGDTTYSTRRYFVTSSSPATGCAPVTNVQFSAISATSATLSFSPVSGAASYTISYYAVGDTANVHTLTTTTPGATLTGLLPGTGYIVRVKTNCSGGGASALVIGTFQTLATTPCGAATNVVVTATSSSTASVSFVPGAGNTGFSISYHLANDSTHWVTTTASPAIITGLLPGQTYYIQVVSYCGASGTTVYTTSGSPITFTFRGAGTLSARSALGAGTLEAYPNPAHYTVSLVLPAVPGAATARITLLNAMGQPVLTKTVALGSPATPAPLDLAGLTPGLYTVRVVAGEQQASQRLVVE